MSSAAEEPMVRRLTAGGSWIRTIGPPVTVSFVPSSAESIANLTSGRIPSENRRSESIPLDSSPASRSHGNRFRATSRSASAWCCSTWRPPITTSRTCSTPTAAGARNCRRWSTASTTATAGVPSASACFPGRAGVQGPRGVSPGAGEVGVLNVNPICVPAPAPVAARWTARPVRAILAHEQNRNI
jgi:hypothetical protein